MKVSPVSPVNLNSRPYIPAQSSFSCTLESPINYMGGIFVFHFPYLFHHRDTYSVRAITPVIGAPVSFLDCCNRFLCIFDEEYGFVLHFVAVLLTVMRS